MSTQGTRSPIEMIWTAKNVPFLFRMFLVQRLGKDDLGGSRPILPGLENATLLEIHTQEQLDFFQMERFVIEDGRRNWWLGGSDRGREGDWVWMATLSGGKLNPTGGWMRTVCTPPLVPIAGLGFWDIACDETYYPVCQRMRQLDKIEFFMDPVHITSDKTGLRFRWNTVFILLPGLETPPSCHGNWLSLGATHTKL